MMAQQSRGVKPNAAYARPGRGRELNRGKGERDARVGLRRLFVYIFWQSLPGAPLCVLAGEAVGGRRSCRTHAGDRPEWNNDR